MEWIVPATVHAEREDGIVVGEDRVRSIPLMHVQIDDRRATYAVIRLEHPHRDGDVVENAEALAMVRERVVRTAGEVHRKTLLERGASSFAGSSHGAI